LKNAGYAAYLVGGCVRDLLLGREPKDFDVTTDAHPEDVRRLFKNCRLIGRRFRLAHVVFGREVIEVATFRAQHAGDEEGGQIEDGGRIVRDNVYGTIEEDAWRRDFTVNALYYNIDGFSVVDFVGGAEDLRAGVLRLIGDPGIRYREDPVRMLRVVRFAAKLGFRLHPQTETPLHEHGCLLTQIAPARLFDEVLKLFHGGCAVQTFELLRHYGLFKYLFPATDECLDEDLGLTLALLSHALGNTDARIAEGKPVTPAFLYAALLWGPMRKRTADYQAEGMTEVQAMQVAAKEVIEAQSRHVTLPRRFAAQVREIWLFQPRLQRTGGKRAAAVLAHARFRAAYDFLLLRRAAGEDLQPQCDWWTKFQDGGEQDRAAMNEQVPRRRPRSRRRRRSRSNGAASKTNEVGPGDVAR